MNGRPLSTLLGKPAGARAPHTVNRMAVTPINGLRQAKRQVGNKGDPEMKSDFDGRVPDLVQME